MQHDRRVLSNGIKHHWILELGCYLTNNVYALRLKACEMSRNARAGFRCTPITVFVRAVWNFQSSRPRSKFTRLPPVWRTNPRIMLHIHANGYDFRRPVSPSSRPLNDLAVLASEITKGGNSPFDLTLNVSCTH